MTDRIDHATEARAALKGAQMNPVDADVMADPWLLAAQVHATLALVEQQRFANLIALATVPGSAGTLETAAAQALLIPADDSVWGARPTIRPEVREGLGL